MLSKKDKDKISICIKEKANFGKIDNKNKFDHPEFNPDQTAYDISRIAPKLNKLLETIRELDDKDLKEKGMLFKHFIYSDIKNNYGVKLVASALKSNGYFHAYKLTKTARGQSFTIDNKTIAENKSNCFATLTSSTFFDKEVGVNFRKELLGRFNARPENNHGEEIRIIILDSGFREGVDLFDIKYVHIFEPILTPSDQKQAIGRATRFCGQKGIQFNSLRGWPLEVYRYETTIPKEIRKFILKNLPYLEPAKTFFELFLKYSSIDPRKLNFANELEKTVILGAVDRYLTNNIHNFKIETDTEEFYIDKLFQGGKQLSKYQSTQKMIREKFGKYKWPQTKIENGCLSPSVGNVKGSTIVEFSLTQDFIRNYFTSKSSQKGMLLFHGVGVGKTCTAIATASTSFEKDNYTIIYVTRHTLKGDVWKNMFGQVCSLVVQDYMKKGMKIPEATAARNRLISDGWFTPLSYKQFSNMIGGKNTLYQDLVKRNGKEDPLRKTLIIIDEAHKLYAPDVSGAEKPDIDSIKKMLLNSYDKSGNESARLLLMTATPYTDDPVDMMKLLNLIRKPSKQLPETFEELSEKYLDINGKFTEKGKLEFLDDIAGQISYLNREKDIRSFAYPIFHDINVPMSDYEFKDLIREQLRIEYQVNDKRTELYRYKIKIANDINVLEENTNKEVLKETDYLSKELNKCLNLLHENRLKKEAEIKDKIDRKKEDCINEKKECTELIKDDYIEEIEDLKEEYKDLINDCPKKDKQCKDNLKKELKEKLNEVKEEQKFDLKEICNKQSKKCLDDLKEEFKLEKILMKPEDRTECNKIEEEIKDVKEIYKERFEKEKEELKKSSNIEFYIEKLNDKIEDLNKSKVELSNEILKDKSQRTALETCLKKDKLVPAYKLMLKNEIPITEDTETKSDSIDGVATILKNKDAKKIYIISGHGNENIINFDKRFIMPKNKVLIVFPVCSKPNYLNTVCDFFDVFNDKNNLDYLSDPIKYKNLLYNKIGHTIRAYLPGENVPEITTDLFLSFDKRKTVIVKSGVYPIDNFQPINHDKITIPFPEYEFNLGSNKCLKYSGMIDSPLDYSAKVHKEIYRGNLYKPASKLESYNTLKYRSFKLSDIMKDVGPGIYYYIGCRSSDQIVKDYSKILENSNKQQEVEDRDKKIKELKLIKTHETTNNKSKSSSSTTSIIEDQNKDQDKDQVIKRTKFTNEDKKTVKEINDLIVPHFLESKSTFEDKTKEWYTILSEMPNRLPVTQTIEKVKAYEYVINKPNLIKEVFKYKKLMKGKQEYKEIRSTTEFTYKKKYVIKEELIGYIKMGIVDFTYKISSTKLLELFKKLEKKKNKIIELPKTTEEWETNDDSELLHVLIQTALDNLK